MALLELESVSRSFGGLMAVRNVTLTVELGSVTGLIGPNGAGKTTVVNLVTGLLSLTSGRVTFDGSDISALQPHEVACRGLSRTFQNIRLLPEQTVRENILIGFHARERASTLDWVVQRRSAREERKRLLQETNALLDEFSMAAVADSPAGALSYGHQRRVEMMRALAASPRLVLLDEPVAGMNDVEADALGAVFRRLANAGMAVLLIEHNMRLVMRLCDRLHVLVSGSLLASGTPAEISTDPRVIDAYLGR